MEEQKKLNTTRKGPTQSQLDQSITLTHGDRVRYSDLEIDNRLDGDFYLQTAKSDGCANMLIVPCGKGELVHALSSLDSQIGFFDIDPQQIDQCRREIRSCGTCSATMVAHTCDMRTGYYDIEDPLDLVIVPREGVQQLDRSGQLAFIENVVRRMNTGSKIILDTLDFLRAQSKGSTAPRYSKASTAEGEWEFCWEHIKEQTITRKWKIGTLEQGLFRLRYFYEEEETDFVSYYTFELTLHPFYTDEILTSFPLELIECFGDYLGTSKWNNDARQLIVLRKV